MARIALITGGAGGMGLATARMFADAGLCVALLDLDEHAAASAAATLPGSGHRGVCADVSDEAQVAAAFAAVERTSGPVAVLAHFAGVAGNAADNLRRPITEETVDNWDRTQRINLRGTFLVVRELLRRRTAQPVPHGRIITCASTAAQSGSVNGGAGYAASKGGVLSFTKMAAREAAPLGITVNCISPGAIDTPMLRAVMPRERDAQYVPLVPMGRIGTAEDIACAALYLASEGASFVTGSVIDVNGGMRMQ